MELTEKQRKQVEELTGYKWEIYRFKKQNCEIDIYLHIYLINGKGNTGNVEHYISETDLDGETMIPTPMSDTGFEKIVDIIKGK